MVEGTSVEGIGRELAELDRGLWSWNVEVDSSEALAGSVSAWMRALLYQVLCAVGGNTPRRH